MAGRWAAISTASGGGLRTFIDAEQPMLKRPRDTADVRMHYYASFLAWRTSYLGSNEGENYNTD